MKKLFIDLDIQKFTDEEESFENEIALTSSEYYFNIAEALRILTDSNDKYTPDQIISIINNLDGESKGF